MRPRIKGKRETVKGNEGETTNTCNCANEKKYENRIRKKKRVKERCKETTEIRKIKKNRNEKETRVRKQS